ncbi:unnamed protein product [Urochloa decumbens]|uniref:Uncharacterized protein n=1 Tax=Urochloa decumbens TaxID=240449 RepID=A0ABC8YE62_9POAL
MPALDEEWAAAAAGDDSGRQRCSCLPFCFWGTKPSGAPTKRRRRRRLRFRFRVRLSWLAWPWFFRKGGAGGGGGESKGKKKRSGRRLMLLFTASLQPKEALASVVSGDSALLPAKVTSFGDAKKQSNRKPRPTTAGGDAASGSWRPQTSSTATAAAASTRWTTSMAPACSRPETSCQPSPRQTDGPAVAAGRIWLAPSRRHSSHRHQFDITERPPGGAGEAWTAAATLGVIVLFGRVTAVVFLCSCLYGTRFVRARVAGAAKASNSTGAGGSGSRRFGEPVAAGVAGEKVFVAEARATEECRKKAAVMAGFLDRAGKAPSSRFGR